MISRHRKLRVWIVVLGAGLWLVGSQLFARADDNTAGTQKTSAPRSTTVKRRTAGKSSAKTARTRRRSRPVNYRYRLARLRLQPDRIVEIQQALIRAGYLKPEPTGKWDEPTRQAMLRFQEEHGFPTTGMPEAKSLMKLGLGSHPLPEDVDPSVGARASSDAAEKSAPTSPANPSPAHPPTTKEPPRKNP